METCAPPTAGDVPQITEKARVRKRRAKTSARPRVRPEEFYVLAYGQHTCLLERNYKKEFLKKMCLHYKLRVGGNKDQLQHRVHEHLRLSAPAVRIQRTYRRHLLRKCATIRGPAYLNRGVSVNETDFFSMLPCAEIPCNQFISVVGSDGHVYSFDILSLSMLFSKRGRDVANPYNRQPFPPDTYANLRKLVRLSRALGRAVVTRPPPSPTQSAGERSAALFHDIYLLGHYPCPSWFDNLSRGNTVRFVRELRDIWEYRAGLSRRTRQEICPPNGNPFVLTTRGFELRSEADVRTGALQIISHMIRDGINDEMKKLGAYYVLCALTLVSPEAAANMPFLYAAVAEDPLPS